VQPELEQAETRELAQIAMRQRIEEQSAAATRRQAICGLNLSQLGNREAGILECWVTGILRLPLFLKATA